MIDNLGPAWFRARLEAQGLPVPALLEAVGDGNFYRTTDGRRQFMDYAGGYRELTRLAGVLLLEDIKRASAPVARNGAASLWDISDGVLCLEFHSAMNSLDPQTLSMIGTAIRLVPQHYKALVIHNEADNF